MKSKLKLYIFLFFISFRFYNLAPHPAQKFPVPRGMPQPAQNFLPEADDDEESFPEDFDEEKTDVAFFGFPDSEDEGAAGGGAIVFPVEGPTSALQSRREETKNKQHIQLHLVFLNPLSTLDGVGALVTWLLWFLVRVFSSFAVFLSRSDACFASFCTVDISNKTQTKRTNPSTDRGNISK